MPMSLSSLRLGGWEGKGQPNLMQHACRATFNVDWLVLPLHSILRALQADRESQA